MSGTIHTNNNDTSVEFIDEWVLVMKFRRVLSKRYTHVTMDHDLCISIEVCILSFNPLGKIGSIQEHIKVMFCTDGADIGSWKVIIEKLIDHVHCVWSNGYPNFLKITVAKSIDFESEPVVITV